MAGAVGPTTAALAPRERRRARARVEIARAALALFQERGYEATTVNDIAEAADYSVRSFYRYFTTKEDVVFFDIGFMLEDTRDALTPPPAPDRVWRVMRENVVASIDRFRETGPEFATEVLRMWLTDPALAGPFYRFCDRWHQVLAHGWTSAHGGPDAEADLGAQQVAHYVVSTCQACFRVHIHTGQDLHQLLTQAFDDLEAGALRLG